MNIRTEDEEEHESSEGSCVSDSRTLTTENKDNNGFNGNWVTRLTEDDQELVLLKHRLYSNLGSTAKICRVVAAYKNLHSDSSAKSSRLLEDFQLYSLYVGDKRGGNPNVRFAWYGTRKEGINRIIDERFDSSRKSDNSGLYGYGIHLSPENSPFESIASSTTDADQLRHVILCKVILGRMEEIILGSKQRHPSSEEFDSGVDNLKVPKKYIIWEGDIKTHIFPVYKLSIRLDLQPQGTNIKPRDGLKMEPRRRPSSPWISFVTLISMISSCVHPSKVCLIKKFCNDYTEGKITRPELIHQLRLFMGDKLLIAALNHFQYKLMKAKMTHGEMQRNVDQQFSSSESSLFMDNLL